VLNSTGRRTALARWIADPENPLSTRVIVNRVWQYHFGRGLVTTSNDFGRLGDRPSHPELLDWLTRRFLEEGWRLKPLHRLILTSAVYRQTAFRSPPPAAEQKDPENRLLWRRPLRRLDAEQIRDAMLSVSGELDLTTGGPSVAPSAPRRSIYVKLLRNKPDPLLDILDAADGLTSAPVRDVTTTPLQALELINGEWALQRAAAMAARLKQEDLPSESERVQRAYQLAYARKPTSAECESAVGFLHKQAAALAGSADADPETAALADLCHVLLNSNEFLYVD
jgi:hypothetical protein